MRLKREHILHTTWDEHGEHVTENTFAISYEPHPEGVVLTWLEERDGTHWLREIFDHQGRPLMMQTPRSVRLLDRNGMGMLIGDHRFAAVELAGNTSPYAARARELIEACGVPFGEPKHPVDVEEMDYCRRSLSYAYDKDARVSYVIELAHDHMNGEACCRTYRPIRDECGHVVRCEINSEPVHTRDEARSYVGDIFVHYDELSRPNLLVMRMQNGSSVYDERLAYDASGRLVTARMLYHGGDPCDDGAGVAHERLYDEEGTVTTFTRRLTSKEGKLEYELQNRYEWCDGEGPHMTYLTRPVTGRIKTVFFAELLELWRFTKDGCA